eukprot:CAMPEP_0184296054 /NCGR_PEP_ID=MMETSP1049-20130417/7019_1 /TAXON_ID=77928 /ORGANISM="Proteomonas sulcata, Strain CCMP704" /LENGTH=61 /DNA_ID=CAMNT_0026605041 /DNA_START=80 /DNA_END=262 /DNA_ORIENTATION=-
MRQNLFPKPHAWAYVGITAAKSPTISPSAFRPVSSSVPRLLVLSAPQPLGPSVPQSLSPSA